MPITAVLGPTNTGKTHLAIERMCGHSSGMIGFPLRLLAREVYDRVAAIKGAKNVALITGEEKILPEGARWLLCTAEAMPVKRDVAFVAIDEAQLAADPERGHVFTDRMLRARGREETMILGSDAIAPIVRALLPEAEIVRRPRFSTLSYAGAKKLSRLPQRSAIVAFSAEQVYAAAEMLRRARGGAAVVMGALSPRTRNAQVAMYQAGEVDYLVATDAIGMGLNMNLGHVAFAGLTKFDGKRQRRLTSAEMAQIAGRAGRHQRDGTFGTLAGGDVFEPHEIEAIENHRFRKLDFVHWRDGEPDLSSVGALIASLEARPDRPELRAAPEAVDLTVLRRLAGEARGDAAKLWAACQLPDFRRVGAEHHALLVGKLFRHLSEGSGHIPADWFAAQLARLDQTTGDVDALGARIADARTWAYIAHRGDWLADPAHWAARSEELEEKLSEALHRKLTERFVDRRTAVLMREIGGDPALFDVTVAEDGAVSVEDEPIGRIDGFAFTVDPDARHGDRKRLLAAAERRLPRERARRAAALVESTDDAFALTTDPVGVRWAGHPVARLTPGRGLTDPRVRLAPTLQTLAPVDREAVATRIEAWVAASLARHLRPLLAMTATAGDLFTPPRVRALLSPLAAAGGMIARNAVDAQLGALDPADRRALRKTGLTIGTLDVFDTPLLKPAPLGWIAALGAARTGTAMPVLPAPGVSVMESGAPIPGFRTVGRKQVRIDLVEKIVRALHDARAARAAFTPDATLAISMGIDAESFAAILRATGFRAQPEGTWTWSNRPRPPSPRPVPRNAAFSALERWSPGD
ncbi:MAG: helicase [Sphingomonadaceae bacterium]|nr:helicase [Sphingomonadaceae bacterium]